MGAALFKLLNGVLAFAWLVAIGTNGAEQFSQRAPVQAAIVIAGTGYFLLIFGRELRQLMLFKNFLFVLSVLVLPLFLMLLSSRSFERNAYTTAVCIVLVFLVAAVLAVRADVEAALSAALFMIVAIGAALNLYELFVANNLWSVAPGRSAGFYLNPNISGEALIGYGLFFLLRRVGKLRVADLIVIALVVIGEFTTFSRAGILASGVLLLVGVFLRLDRQQMGRVILGGVLLASLASGFAAVVLTRLDLSEDAAKRIDSLVGAGGLGDYEKDRGAAASEALDVIEQSPVLGAGVGTINDMEEGPHNMFLGMLLEYGIGGLLAYLTLIVLLIFSARGVERNLAAPVLAFVAWIIIFSFSSHNLLGNASTIPLLGFALAHGCRIYYLRKTAQAKPLIVLGTIACES